MTEQPIGIVYKDVPKDENATECYVGSTTQTLNCRLTKHRYHFNLWWADKFCWVAIFHLFLLYGIDQVDIIELELCQVDQLKQREQHWIEEISTVDQNRSFRTEKQIKEQIKESMKNAHSCACGGQYTNRNKKRHINSDMHQAFLANQISLTAND